MCSRTFRIVLFALAVSAILGCGGVIGYIAVIQTLELRNYTFAYANVTGFSGVNKECQVCYGCVPGTGFGYTPCICDSYPWTGAVATEYDTKVGTERKLCKALTTVNVCGNSIEDAAYAASGLYSVGDVISGAYPTATPCLEFTRRFNFLLIPWFISGVFVIGAVLVILISIVKRRTCFFFADSPVTLVTVPDITTETEQLIVNKELFDTDSVR